MINFKTEAPIAENLYKELHFIMLTIRCGVQVTATFEFFVFEVAFEISMLRLIILVCCFIGVVVSIYFILITLL